MRDLTFEELEFVSGGLGWFDEVSQWVQDVWNDIFQNTSNQPPSIPTGTIDNFVDACYKAGGTSSVTILSGSIGANVKMVNANGSVTYAKMVCSK